MENQEKFVRGMAGKATHEIFESVAADDDKRSNRTVMIVILILATILLIIGNQGMKVIFRTNFGRNQVSKALTILVSVAFIGWGILAYSITGNMLNSPMIQVYGGEYGFIIASIFYIILGVMVLFIGINEANKAKKSKIDPDYKGDSILLGFLENNGWGQRNIQYFAEPLALFSVALIFTVIHPFLGFPLIFCWISLIIHNGYYGVAADKPKKAGERAERKMNDEFSSVTL